MNPMNVEVGWEVALCEIFLRCFFVSVQLDSFVGGQWMMAGAERGEGDE
jgi:hypothetical protein